MVAEDEDTGTLPDPSDKFEELLTRLKKTILIITIINFYI